MDMQKSKCTECGKECPYPHHIRFTELGPDALVNPLKQKHYCSDECFAKAEKVEFEYFKKAWLG
jgi:hypothetical protein